MNPGVRRNLLLPSRWHWPASACRTDYIHVLFLQIQNAEQILSEGQASAADLQEGKLLSLWDQNSLLNCKKFPVLREFGREARKARRNAEPLCGGRAAPNAAATAHFCSDLQRKFCCKRASDPGGRAGKSRRNLRLLLCPRYPSAKFSCRSPTDAANGIAAPHCRMRHSAIGFASMGGRHGSLCL